MKALIPAAGLGTRFLPATKAVPKELLPVLNKPVIQYVVEEGLSSGADEVIIISSHDKVGIEQHFCRNEALEQELVSRGKAELAEEVRKAGCLNVGYVYQEEPLGLGHAVLCAAEKTGDQPFFVLLGDVIVPDYDICPRMLEISREHDGASVIAVLPVPDEEVHRFGIMDGVQLSDDVWKVNRLVEKPRLEDAPSNLSVFGRYLLSPRVMELLKNAKPGPSGEIQLTEALDAVLQEEEMYALIVKDEQGYDAGTVDSWIATNNALLARRAAGRL